MNRLWLKIVGCVVVVLLAAIAVYVFRPASRPVPESKDSKQVQEPAENKLATEAKLPRPRPSAEELYQTALHQEHEQGKLL